MRTANALMVALLLAGGAARGDAPVGPLTLAVEEDQVIVSARGAMPKNGQIKARGLWLDIDLAQAAGVSRVLIDDSTLKRMDLTAGEAPKLSLLLHRDMQSERFAAAARIEVTNQGLRVFVPRDPKRVSGAQLMSTTVTAPVVGCTKPASAATPPTVVTAPPAPPAPPVPPAEPRLPVEALGLAPSVDAHPMVGVADARISPINAAAMVLLVAGAVVALVLMRRKQRAVAPGESIRIVSQTVIAPKVRLVLVAVADREVLLSVTDKGAQPVGRWRRVAPVEGEDEIAEPARAAQQAASSMHLVSMATTLGARGGRTAEPKVVADALPEIDVELPSMDDEPRPSRRNPVVAAAQHAVAAAHHAVSNAASPAVAGLLRLRRPAETTAMAAIDPKADEAWARELLAAMRGQGAA